MNLDSQRVSTFTEKITSEVCMWLQKNVALSGTNQISLLSKRHGLTYILEHALNLGLIDISNTDKVHQTKCIKDAAVKRLIMLAVLKKINTSFTDKKIKFILLKGFALEVLMYPSEYSRMCMDIDILTLPVDFENACNIISTISDAEISISKKSKTSRTFICQGIPIDLHSKIDEPGFSKVPTENLFKDVVLTSIGGVSYCTLNNINQGAHILAHGSKHLWCRVKWILDIILYFEMNHQSKWPILIQKISEIIGKRRTLVGLLVASLYSCSFEKKIALALDKVTKRDRNIAAIFFHQLHRLRAGIFEKLKNRWWRLLLNN